MIPDEFTLNAVKANVPDGATIGEKLLQIFLKNFGEALDSEINQSHVNSLFLTFVGGYYAGVQDTSNIVHKIISNIPPTTNA